MSTIKILMIIMKLRGGIVIVDGYTSMETCQSEAEKQNKNFISPTYYECIEVK